jgi:hypothetical protein
MECHEFAKEAKDALLNRRYINGKHSFQVFLEDIRNWIQAEEIHSHCDVA